MTLRELYVFQANRADGCRHKARKLVAEGFIGAAKRAARFSLFFRLLSHVTFRRWGDQLRARHKDDLRPPTA